MAMEAMAEEAFQASKKAKSSVDDEVIVIIDILAHPLTDGCVVSQNENAS